MLSQGGARVVAPQIRRSWQLTAKFSLSRSLPLTMSYAMRSVLVVICMSTPFAISAVAHLPHLLDVHVAAHYAQLQNPAPMVPLHVFGSWCEPLEAKPRSNNPPKTFWDLAKSLHADDATPSPLRSLWWLPATSGVVWTTTTTTIVDVEVTPPSSVAAEDDVVLQATSDSYEESRALPNIAGEGSMTTEELAAWEKLRWVWCHTCGGG